MSIVTGWYRPIEDAIASAREADDHVPFEWDGVTIRVHPGDLACVFRARWKAASHEETRPPTHAEAQETKDCSLTDGEADALARVFGDPTGGGR